MSRLKIYVAKFRKAQNHFFLPDPDAQANLEASGVSFSQMILVGQTLDIRDRMIFVRPILTVWPTTGFVSPMATSRPPSAVLHGQD